MSKVTCDVSISLDGCCAGPNQTAEKPMGDGVNDRLGRWMFEDADDHQRALDAILDAGAFVMGRNMFGPGRGDWDLDWKGWWGDTAVPRAGVRAHPPPARVAPDGRRHHVHFVTDGIESALAQARAAAGDRDVSIAGGAATVSSTSRRA